MLPGAPNRHASRPRTRPFRVRTRLQPRSNSVRCLCRSNNRMHFEVDDVAPMSDPLVQEPWIVCFHHLLTVREVCVHSTRHGREAFRRESAVRAKSAINGDGIAIVETVPRPCRASWPYSFVPPISVGSIRGAAAPASTEQLVDCRPHEDLGRVQKQKCRCALIREQQRQLGTGEDHATRTRGWRATSSSPTSLTAWSSRICSALRTRATFSGAASISRSMPLVVRAPCAMTTNPLSAREAATVASLRSRCASKTPQTTYFAGGGGPSALLMS